MTAYLAALIFALTGSPTPTHCASVPAGVEGFTVISGDVPVEIALSPASCRRIRSADPVRAADGWYVLGHEAVHAVHPSLAHEDPTFEPLAYWNMERLLCLSTRGSAYRRVAVQYAGGPAWDGTCETPRPVTNGGV